MKVGAGHKAAVLAAVSALVSAGLVLTPTLAGVVHAAEFVNPPERLYMVPDGTLLADLEAFATSAGIPDLALVPIEELKFDGGDDIISGDTRTITVDTVTGNDGCDLTAVPYDIDDCSRVQLSGISHGRISLGPIDPPIVDGGGEGFDVYLLEDGARIDGPYQTPAGSFSLGINGTPEQLQDALDDLVYTPDPGYYYDGGVGETLHVLLQPGTDGQEETGSDSIDIQIRVLNINGFPSHNGPSNRTAEPNVELKLPSATPSATRPYPTALFTVADADNDEPIDSDTNDPGELTDGANTAMMLIGWLDCGPSTVLDDGQHGFHFRGGTFQSDDVQIEDFFEILYDVNANPDYQLVIDGLVAALDAIDPTLKSIELATSNPADYTTAFAGVGDIAAVEYALSQVSFRHDDPGATCELITVVLDLGNNGLPLQYLGSPPTGIEIPFIGFDWNALTLNVAQPQEIDISFDPEPIFVLEGNPTEARMLITPGTHPEFRIGWEANPKNGDPEVPGIATADVDFAGTYNNSPMIPVDSSEVSASTNLTLQLPDEMVYADNDDVEGIETFEYRILPDAYDPPPGYAITSEVPTRTVYILDDDDADRKVDTFVGTSTFEGDPGGASKQLTFELTLDDIADGNESVTVSLGAGTADGSDHDPFPPVVVEFEPGQESATFTIPITEDFTPEADETVVLELSDFQNMDMTGPTQATATIQNDDALRHVIAVTGETVFEGDSLTTANMFTITLDVPAKLGDSVRVNTSGASPDDYVDLVDVTVPLLAGQINTTVIVEMNGDINIEPDETITLSLDDPSADVVLDVDEGTATIQNDDGLPQVSISNGQVVEGDSGPAMMNFTVSLVPGAIAPSSVTVTSAHGGTDDADFLAVNEVVNFAAGDPSKQVSVAVNGDPDAEFDETFTLTLSAPSGLTIGDSSGTGLITNDDITVSFIPQLPNMEGSPLSIVVSVWPPVTHDPFDVSVTLVPGTAVEGSDYFPFTGNPLTIPANQAGSADVQTIPDFDVEPDEALTATLAVGTEPPNFTVRWDGVPAQLTILNNDVQSVVSIADALVVEGGASNQVALSMTNDNKPFRECSVRLISTDVSATSPDDFTALSAPGLMQLLDDPSETVPLDIVNDSVPDEAPETFTIAITLDPPVQPNSALGTSQATITIVDNDVANPTLSISGASINEGTGAGTTNISLNVTTSGVQQSACGFRVVLSHGTTVDADFTTAPGLFDQTVVFDTNDVSLAQTFGITRDVLDEPNETFTVTISPDVGHVNPCAINAAAATATGTITDDDAPFPQLSIADASVVEGTAVGSTPIGLMVSIPSPMPIACQFRAVLSHVTTNDDDFSVTAFFDVLVVWDTDDSAVPRPFQIAWDSDDELNETFTVTITGDSTGGQIPCSIGDGVATGTVVDDDGLPPDTTNPTVMINKGTTQPDPTGVSPIVFEVLFSEAVLGFTDSDVTVTGSAGATSGVVTGIGPAYMVTVSNMTGSGTVIATIDAGKVTDLAGNPNDAAMSVDNSVQFNMPDTTGPTVTVSVAGGQANPTPATPILFTVEFNESVADFATGDVTVTGTAGATSGTVTGSGTTYQVSVSNMTGPGLVTVSVAGGVAHDSSDNPNSASNSASVQFIVLPVPLSLTVPPNITRNNDPGQAGAVVTFLGATALGGSPPVDVSCDKTSGSFFPLGVTTVSCTATDAEQGLENAIIFGQFTITVVDAEPPLIADLPDLTRQTVGTTPVTVTYALPTASDNSGVAPSVTCTPSSASSFQVGVATVTCTATDGAGLTASSSFTVTVVSDGSGGLPPTGSSSGRTASMAAILIAAGWVLVAVRRRQSSSARA